MPDLIQRTKATTPNEYMVFKEHNDLQMWRSNTLPVVLRDQLALANSIALFHFGRCIRVTAIVKDGPFHKQSHFCAADISADSAGDRAYFGDLAWDEESSERYQAMLIDAGIPVVLVNKGKTSAHWHIGPVATLLYNRG